MLIFRFHDFLFKFQDISAPEYDAQKNFKWNLIYGTENVYNPYVTSMTDTGRKQTAENILNEFNNDVIPKLRRLPKQWIHGDLNNFDVLQHEFDESNEIVGIIDSDNMVYTYRVVELATMLMYLTTTSTGERSIEIAQQAFRGYCSLIELNEVELDILYNLILVRYVRSCCIGEYTYKYYDPENEYILATAKTSWHNLEYIISLGKNNFLSMVHEQFSC